MISNNFYEILEQRLKYKMDFCTFRQKNIFNHSITDQNSCNIYTSTTIYQQIKINKNHTYQFIFIFSTTISIYISPNVNYIYKNKKNKTQKLYNKFSYCIPHRNSHGISTYPNYRIPSAQHLFLKRRRRVIGPPPPLPIYNVEHKLDPRHPVPGDRAAYWSSQIRLVIFRKGLDIPRERNESVVITSSLRPLCLPAAIFERYSPARSYITVLVPVPTCCVRTCYTYTRGKHTTELGREKETHGKRTCVSRTQGATCDGLYYSASLPVNSLFFFFSLRSAPGATLLLPGRVTSNDAGSHYHPYLRGFIAPSAQPSSYFPSYPAYIYMYIYVARNTCRGPIAAFP